MKISDLSAETWGAISLFFVALSFFFVGLSFWLQS
jgi:hypothetical protein